MNGPDLTICIPTYDRLHYLREAVASALGQTWQNVEVLISDDGDSSELAKWARGMSQEDPRVVYYKNDVRLGLAGNWQACANRARGRYATFMGDDDRLRPEFAAKLLQAAEGGADVVFSNHYVIDGEGGVNEAETASMQARFRRDELPPGLVARPELWVWRNSIPMSSAIIKTEVAQRLGFKHDLNTPEIEFYARLANQGGSFCFVPEYLADYRSHATSLTSGGLRVEHLLKYLEPIAVAPEVEPEKRALLAEFGVAALHRLLLSGDVNHARVVCSSPYYPSLTRVDRATVQRVFAHLPWGAPAYRVLFPLARRAVTAWRATS